MLRSSDKVAVHMQIVIYIFLREGRYPQMRVLGRDDVLKCEIRIQKAREKGEEVALMR